MSAHVAVDLLSALLDGELPVAERQTAARHLAECPACRHRLDGLREVAAGLAALNRAATPRALDLRVATLSPPWRTARPRRSLRSLVGVDSVPQALPLSALLVLAAALWLVGTSAPVSEEDAAGAPMLLVLPEPVSAAQGEVVANEGRTGRRFLRLAGRWTEVTERGAGAVARPASAVERAALLAAEPTLRLLLAMGPVELEVGGERLLLAAEVER